METVLLVALLGAGLSQAATEEAKPVPAVQKEAAKADAPKSDTPKVEAGKAETVKKEVQGPALSAPREMFELLEQRKRMLDKREATLRGSETHLLELKAELEQIVTRHEQAVEAEKNDGKPLKPREAMSRQRPTHRRRPRRL